METQKKLELLSDLFEVTFTEQDLDKNLSEIETWDSMTKLSLIVLFDDELNQKLTGEQIRSFKTISDILAAM